MERVVSDSLFDVRLYLAVMAAFATIAFALALTGTYSVIARVAASRSSEFALRYALGAGARQVAVLVLSRGLLLTGIGLGLGLVMVLAVSPLLASLPLAVRPPDLPILAPIGIVILLVAALASLVPARRAARTAPASILRG
jgi:ABC-type antimicrobial peptide transport system permease subunit